jgi:hypothetical protein
MKSLYKPVPAPVSHCGPSPLAVPCAPFLPISRALFLLLCAAASSAPQLCVTSSRAPALPFVLLYTTSRPRPLRPRAVPSNAPPPTSPVSCKYTRWESSSASFASLYACASASYFSFSSLCLSRSFDSRPNI